MRITALASFIALCAMPLLPLFAQTHPSFRTYRSEEHGFQMDYLNTWKPEPGNKPWIVTRFAPASPDDPRVARAAIGVPTFSHRPVKLEEIGKVMVEELRTIIPDATLGIAVESTLGGEPAWRMIITGTSAGPNPVRMRALVVATLHNEKAYVVGLAAPQDEWERMRDGLDLLLPSFKFLTPRR